MSFRDDFWGASRGLGPSKIDAGKEGCINYMHLSSTNQCLNATWNQNTCRIYWNDCQNSVVDVIESYYKQQTIGDEIHVGTGKPEIFMK